MNRTFYILSWIVITSAIGLMLLVSYWYFFPYNIITFKTDKFIIVNKEVKQNEYLVYNSQYCKNLPLVSSTSRSFVNGIIYTTPSTMTDRETGCHKIKVQVHVPPELPPGVYYLVVIYQYKVNPVRTITVKRITEKFTVIESTKSAELRVRDY